MLSPMFLTILGVVRALAEKKQVGELNKLKVNMINMVLEQIKDLLSDEPTIQFLVLLDDETLPTVSDTVFILEQYGTALRPFQNKYSTRDIDQGINRWFTKEAS